MDLLGSTAASSKCTLCSVEALRSSAMCCRANVVANSWTSETKKHHAGPLLPDLTARSFEDDKITLKCKGDATVSSEPDGSILGLARQELSSGAAAIFSLFFLPLLCWHFLFFEFFFFFFFRTSNRCLAPSLVRYQ